MAADHALVRDLNALSNEELHGAYGRAKLIYGERIFGKHHVYTQDGPSYLQFCVRTAYSA